MNQILHIFKKDAEHHWPEILISLALLGLSTRQELHPWEYGSALYSLRPTFSVLAGRYVTPVTIIFWVFLIIRVVQAESLVGDRQWWVTKPYEWWNLLAAKLLFIVIFISVPLFHVHLLLLHQFGFPILPNLPALLLSQLAFYFALFLPTLLLASSTKNFGQFLLTVGCIFAVVAGIAWMASKNPSGDMENPPAIVEHIQSFLLWGSVIAVLLWQFARRRRLVSAGGFVAMLAVNGLIGVVVPNAKTMEKDYARVEAQTAPAKIAIVLPAGSASWRITGLPIDPASSVNLSVPISVAGVASGTMVMVDVIRISTNSAEDRKWNRGWKYQQVQLWPEDQSKLLSYELSRKQYEKIKTQLVNLHIELGLSEYQEADPRILHLPPRKFTDETLGVCRVAPWRYSYLECLNPFRAPGLMATFDAQKSPCKAAEGSNSTQEKVMSHAWIFSNHDSFPNPHYSPITDYFVAFNPVSLLTDEDKKQGNRDLILCADSEVRLARPELKRQVRIELDVPNVRLEDFASTNDGE